MSFPRTSAYLIALPLLLQSTATPAADTLCQDHEKTLFSCRSGSKTIAVCASPELSPRAGYVQFRYGTPGSDDIILWPEARYPRQFVSKGNVFLAGRIGIFLRFRMDNTSFIVFSSPLAADGPNSRDSGLVIQHRALLQSKHRCDMPTKFQFADLPLPSEGIVAVSGLNHRQ